MCLHIAVEVVADEIVIAVLDDAVTQGREAAGVAKGVGLDGVKHLGEVWVELEGAVLVCVPEILNILGQITKKEDVGLADFSGDFDLSRNKVRKNSCEVQRKSMHKGAPEKQRKRKRETNISTVAGSDDETAIQYKLHITRA